MVVLGAAVVTKKGQLLVSRQWVPMTRIRVEALLSAFVKLVSGPEPKQHTYIETETMRYIYQPLEDTMFIVLLTNRVSNIIEDLTSLGLVARSITDCCGGWINEENLENRAFDIISHMDEVIHPGGYRDVQNLGQVRTAVLMDSHEEKLHNMILKSKIRETKDHMKRKARELDREKAEKARMEREGGRRGSGSGSLYKSFNSPSSMDYYRDPAATMGSSDSSMMPSLGGSGSSSVRSKEKSNTALPSRGMSLGRKKDVNTLLEGLAREGEDVLDTRHSTAGAKEVAPAAPRYPIEGTLSEKLRAEFHQDGSLEKMEVQGQLSFTVNNESVAQCEIQLDLGVSSSDFHFVTHPKIDRALFQSSDRLTLRDRGGSFPIDNSLGLLKWRTTLAEERVPLNVNCWPSESRGETYVNVEYDASEEFELKHVIIKIPVSENPKVTSIDVGDTSYNSRESMLLWEIDLIDSGNRMQAMEFVTRRASPDSFFPIKIEFQSENLFCPLQVSSISAGEEASVRHSLDSLLETDQYLIG